MVKDARTADAAHRSKVPIEGRCGGFEAADL